MKYTQENFERYFRGQQISLQWLSFLNALAKELSANADATDLHQLFFRIGGRFAEDLEQHFQGIQTLSELEDALNKHWSGIKWGLVTLNEVKSYIDIHHQYAPLSESFGDDALIWSIGFLEGFYEKIFKVLGAGDSMVVRAIELEPGSLDIHFHFGNF